MNPETLIPRLISEFGYPAAGARLIAGKLARCTPKIKEAFLVFWETGQILPLDIEGYNIERLVNEHGMKPVAAFLTLDWLAREPEKAEASLRKGHDQVTGL